MYGTISCNWGRLVGAGTLRCWPLTNLNRLCVIFIFLQNSKLRFAVLSVSVLWLLRSSRWPIRPVWPEAFTSEYEWTCSPSTTVFAYVTKIKPTYLLCSFVDTLNGKYSKSPTLLWENPSYHVTIWTIAALQGSLKSDPSFDMCSVVVDLGSFWCEKFKILFPFLSGEIQHS